MQKQKPTFAIWLMVSLMMLLPIQSSLGMLVFAEQAECMMPCMQMKGTQMKAQDSGNADIPLNQHCPDMQADMLQDTQHACQGFCQDCNQTYSVIPLNIPFVNPTTQSTSFVSPVQGFYLFYALQDTPPPLR